jgi:hypothetical protein
MMKTVTNRFPKNFVDNACRGLTAGCWKTADEDSRRLSAFLSELNFRKEIAPDTEEHRRKRRKDNQISGHAKMGHADQN